jgi:prolyl-tRNA synthetase
MRYSKLFGKTKKSSKDFDSVNATLLIKGGFVDQTMAGVYTYLPLGLRVLSKIENIVREEMNKIGDELLMPALVPQELWQTTGRYETVDILFKASGANELSKALNDAEYVLSPTHEDTVTPLAKKFNVSYKDLPFGVYQIQNKYRNEARPKSGLLRGREFRMKDLYSFHKDEAELKAYYNAAIDSYFNVYEKLGLRNDTYLTAASGGDFTEDFSHEFQIKCETGEDLVFRVKSKDICFNKEVAPSKAPMPKQETKIKDREDVFGEGIIGVEDLCKFLKITPDQTSKTLIYVTDTNEVIVTSLRGDYEVNELKLKKAAHVKSLKLADEKTVKKVTGADVGYAGIVNLPKDIKVFIDDSLENLVNFETGANKTNYHIANVNWGRDVTKPEKFYDIKTAKEGDMYPETEEVYEVFIASEAGNIFPLYTKYSEAFNYKYLDKDGSQKLVYMGSYGIGISRIMGILVEKFHDEKGIVWPENAAPFKIHLLGINIDDEAVKSRAEEVYEKLIKEGIEVLYDDRSDVTAGEKFADADLIGCPFRVVVSKKTGDKIEVKKRGEAKAEVITLEEFCDQSR